MPGQAATDTIWSALVLGTNSEQPKRIPQALEPYAPMLTRVFGYNAFEVIGQHSESIANSQAQWLLPSKHFFLRVASQRIKGSEHKLDLSLYQDKQLLVETTARLGTHSPLVIRGPLYGQGQLIILLVVVK